MLRSPRRRTAATLVGLLVLAMVSIVAAVLLPRPSFAGGTATLTIFSGTVQVERSGNTTYRDAGSGDLLAGGDRLQTGPTTKAAITFPDDSVTRLDSGTQLTVSTLTRAPNGGSVVRLEQAGGRTWNSVKQTTAGGRFGLSAPSGSEAETSGATYSVLVEKNSQEQVIVRFDSWNGSTTVKASGQAVAIGNGQSTTVQPSLPPTPPLPIPPTDRNSFFTVFNQTADTAVGTPAALTADTVNQGEATSVHTGADGDGNTDLDFALGWPGSRFELTVFGPDGDEFQTAASDTPPIHIAVARAMAGNWSYRVRDLVSGPHEAWWVLVSKTTPSRLAPALFFATATPCDHSVTAGQSDSWTLAARSSAARPDLTTRGLPAYGSIQDNHDGSARLSFSPPAATPAGDVTFDVIATAGGASATVSCTEQVGAPAGWCTIGWHAARYVPGVQSRGPFTSPQPASRQAPS